LSDFRTDHGKVRQQMENPTAQTVRQHLLDGGDLRTDDLEQAHTQGGTVCASQTAKHPGNRRQELDIKPGDSAAVRAGKRRYSMASEEGDL
jgi:hypothetical protein